MAMVSISLKFMFFSPCFTPFYHLLNLNCGKFNNTDDILQLEWMVSQIELYQLSCNDCIATNRYGTNIPFYVTLEEKA